MTCYLLTFLVLGSVAFCSRLSSLVSPVRAIDDSEPCNRGGSLDPGVKAHNVSKTSEQVRVDRVHAMTHDSNESATVFEVGAAPLIESAFDGLWDKQKTANTEHIRFSDGFDFGAPPQTKLSGAMTVLVAGASSAGLTSALEAHDEGADVTIVEKRTASYIRNNVLALDPMVVQKLFHLGMPTTVFALAESLPLYGDAAEWADSCLTEHKKEELTRENLTADHESVTQDHVKCSDEGEGIIKDSGYAFIRTRCLEEELLKLVQNRGIPIIQKTEVVGFAIGAGDKFAILRGNPGSDIGDGKEFLFKADVFVLAVGPGIRNQQKQEYKKWFIVSGPCTGGDANACPEWLNSARAAQRTLAKWLNNTKARKLVNSTPAEDKGSDLGSSYALDMVFEYKGIMPAGSPWPELVDANPNHDAVLVSLRSRSCANWIAKLPASSGNVLGDQDQDLTLRYVFGLDLHVNPKLSYAMTAIFMPLKRAGVSWATLHKNAAWNSESSRAQFEDVTDKYRAGNWLGNNATADWQQVRIFPNRCLIYVTIGLTHSKAHELLTAAGAELDTDSSVTRCASAAKDATTCDGVGFRADGCGKLEPYAIIEPGSPNQGYAVQVALLEKLAGDAGIEGRILKSRMAPYTHTFFVVNLFVLGPTPPESDPLFGKLFIVGDAGHAPNFLSGCGVIGGQDDTNVVAEYIKYRIRGTKARTAARCAMAKLKIIQGLVFERSCLYSDCHHHSNMQFLGSRLGTKELTTDRVLQAREAAMLLLTEECAFQWPQSS